MFRFCGGGVVPKAKAPLLDGDHVPIMMSPSTTYISKELANKIDSDKTDSITLTIEHWRPISGEAIKEIRKMLNGLEF